MTFKPQSQAWPGKRAVLMVHGIGDASTGKDSAFPVDAVKDVLGAEAKTTALYRLNYDFINDWLVRKVGFDAAIKALKGRVKTELGDDDSSKTIADYVGDILWPVFSPDLRFAVRDAFVSQLQQIQVDRGEAAIARGDDPLDYSISIVAHSLGCFHTYEVLAAIAKEPSYRLRPVSDLFTLGSVMLMASPVQLIRSVAGAIGAFVPDPASLATLSGELAIPSESVGARSAPVTRRFVSITGSHDPVGGHLLGHRLNWAYMNIPGQSSIVVPQQTLNIDTKEGTALALAHAFAAGGPQVNDPHSWSAYIASQAGSIREQIVT